MKAMLLKTPAGLRGATPDDLRSALEYDPESGVLRWTRTGRSAGTVTKHGYVRVNFGGQMLMAHRIAWALLHGAWPEADIDHRDGDRANNRQTNLRQVNRQVNLQNRRSASSNKVHGTLLGAAWHEGSGKWRALIKHGGRQKALGYYATEMQAHEAYLAAKRRLHEGCTI